MSRRIAAATISFAIPGMLAALGLALTATTAHASRDRWLQLGGSAQGRVSIDTANIERTPRHLKFWTLLTYAKPQPGGVRAEKRLFLYACKEKSLQWQQSITYPDPLGEEALLQVYTRSRDGSESLLQKVLDRSTNGQLDRQKTPLPEEEFVAVFSRLCQ